MRLLRGLGVRRSFLLAVVLVAQACSGSVSCGGCAGGLLDPIPGGFPREALFDRAAELRLSQSGLDFIGREFPQLATAFARMACGPGEPVDCPTDFVVSGQRAPTACGPANTCVDGAGVAPPVLGFAIDQAVQSGATVCRDDPSLPGARACAAWLRLEGLRLRPVAPNQLEATVTAQIYTTIIPLRYDPLGMDCVVTLDSNASGPGQQDFVVTVQLEPWAAPPGVEGGRLDVRVVDVTAAIPDQDLSISRDPVHGDGLDVLSCGLANIGRIKTALVGRLVGSLGDVIDGEIGDVLAQRCGRPEDTACPSSTTCNADGRCVVDATGDFVPQLLGLDGRIDFRGLVAGFGSPTAGAADLSGLVGGTASTDASGASIGLRAGLELAVADPACGAPGANPRLRAGATPPAPFPTTPLVDLDFDGVAERSYMVAAGVSQPILDQLIWGAAGAGLFCASVSAYETELVNTGSLSILMPSLQQLTHNDRYPWSVWPARVAIRPAGAPALLIGEGRTSGTSPNFVLESPLLTLRLPQLELSFDAVIEERWLHLMRVVADVDVPLGVVVEPGGQLRLVVGDLANAISNVQVLDSKVLAESPAELAQAVPTLLSLVLPQLTEQLGVPIALPSGAELGGFEPTVLGVRGVPGAGGTFSHVGVYLDLAFDPSLAPRLREGLDTRARVDAVRRPSSAQMSVLHEGGVVVPTVDVVLDHVVPPGERSEVQVRVDGGAWSPFTESSTLQLRRAEWLVQGRHQLELRARLVGRPDTLDPSPATLEVVIDSEPPHVVAALDERTGIVDVDAVDLVSGTVLRYELVVDGVARGVELDTGRLSIPADSKPDRGLELHVSDEVGNTTAVVLRTAAIEATPTHDEAAGCTTTRSTPMVSFLSIVAVWAVVRRRKP
jgi:hypothetical protein